MPLVEVSGIKSGSPLLSFNKEVGTVKEIQIKEPRIVAGNQPGENKRTSCQSINQIEEQDYLTFLIDYHTYVVGEGSGGGLSDGAIAGIVIGSVVGAVVIALLVVATVKMAMDVKQTHAISRGHPLPS